MKNKALILPLLALAGSSAALANHHAFSAYFDVQRPFSATGAVVSVDCVNPAVFVHLKVEDKATGTSTLWAFEGESANAMQNKGLDKAMFRQGETVTAIGWRGKPGTNLSETVADPDLKARVRAASAASVAQFEFSDGKKIPVVANVPQPLTQVR